MSRPAIVGQAPSMRAGAARALDGRSGVRLAELAGVTLEELRGRYRLVNLLRRWPGPNEHGKGCAFDRAAARERARRLPLAPGSILLGRNVAAAYGLARAPFLTWLEPTRVAVLPHPSGVNRWWNDPENLEAAREFLRAAWSDLGG